MFIFWHWLTENETAALQGWAGRQEHCLCYFLTPGGAGLSPCVVFFSLVVPDFHFINRSNGGKIHSILILNWINEFYSFPRLWEPVVGWCRVQNSDGVWSGLWVRDWTDCLWRLKMNERWATGRIETEGEQVCVGIMQQKEWQRLISRINVRIM